MAATERKGLRAILRTKLSFDVVWQRIDEKLAAELAEMWLAHQALPTPEHARERAREVAIVARDGDGTIAGVATLRERYVPRLVNHFYTYRCFVTPKWRRTHLAAELAYRVALFTDEEFQSGKQTKCIGLVGITDNPNLIGGVKDAVTATVPFVFIGVTEKGQHVRVFYFKGAKIARD